jgi:multimeric flavodoxin WrbA
MKITIISASPRKGKNSEQILEFCKKLLEEKKVSVTEIKISENKINPCIHCDLCKKENSCSQRDDMNHFYPNISSSDAIVCISPTYMGSMTSQMKAFLDRTVVLRRNGFKLKGKIGAAISVGHSRNGGQEYTVNQIHHAFLIHGMLIAGDGNHFGGTVAGEFSEDLFGQKTVNDTIEYIVKAIKKEKEN